MARKMNSNQDKVVSPNKRAWVEGDDSEDASLHFSALEGEVDSILKHSFGYKVHDGKSNKGKGVSDDAEIPAPTHLPLKVITIIFYFFFSFSCSAFDIILLSILWEYLL